MSLKGLDPQLVAAIVGGLIGIVGSIGTIIASHFLRVAGKVTANFAGVEYQFYKDIGSHTYEDTTSIDQAAAISLKVGVDLYNSSDIPRSLKKLSLELNPHASKKVLS